MIKIDNSNDNNLLKAMSTDIYQILAFFLPLAFTSILIVSGYSLVNAGLARLSTPAILISAFAVAKSLVFFLESPVAITRQMVTALVDDYDSYLKTKRFIFIVAISIILFFFLLYFSGMIEWIFENVMGIRGQILEQALVIFRVLIFFPIAVVIRDFYQGIAIKAGRTSYLTISTVIRIMAVLIIVLIINRIERILPAGIIAGGMLLISISITSLVMLLAVYLIIKEDINWNNFIQKPVSAVVSSESITYRDIFSFFWPLALTVFMKTTATPIINMGLARAIQPELALSVYAVAWSLGMIFLSPLMMYHQVSLHFIDIKNGQNYNNLKKFSLYLGMVLSFLLFILSFTDIGKMILINLIGVTEEMAVLSNDLLKVMIFLPLIMTGREFYWGIFMKMKKTSYIVKGKILNLVALALTISLTVNLEIINPAIFGIIALINSQMIEFLYLFSVFRRDKKGCL